MAIKLVVNVPTGSLEQVLQEHLCHLGKVNDVFTPTRDGKSLYWSVTIPIENEMEANRAEAVLEFLKNSRIINSYYRKHQRNVRKPR